ncbi:hypothetical protein IWZ03DRAFT_390427 [Phyllosticta citriasiana]|uniref:Uncharacterized protein n=1 Tax=Phyllosticta citriasiana TaxID=595635 RepID=A0ABR1K841_9PEZI
MPRRRRKIPKSDICPWILIRDPHDPCAHHLCRCPLASPLKYVHQSGMPPRRRPRSRLFTRPRGAGSASAFQQTVVSSSRLAAVTGTGSCDGIHPSIMTSLCGMNKARAPSTAPTSHKLALGCPSSVATESCSGFAKTWIRSSRSCLAQLVARRRHMQRYR